MKKFNKIVTVIVAFAMIVSSLTMLAIHDEHVHVHAAAPETGKVWALHDKNANDEYIAFSANNTSPFSFVDVHQYYTNDSALANVTGNNEQYDGRTFGNVGLTMIDGEAVEVGGSGYKVNKAAVYQKDSGALIAAVIEATTGNTNTNIAAGEIWGTCLGVNTVAVVFTAPADGNYTISETARRWWPNNTTAGGTEFQQPCKIVIEHANGKETKVLQTGAQTGTASVTLNLIKGEKVKVFMDSMGSGAGDNFEIEALTATYNGPVNLTVGETFTFSNFAVFPGSANNGKFTMKGFIRSNPTYGAEESEFADIWGAYDRRSPVKYTDLKNSNSYDGNQYVINGAPNNTNEIHKMILNGSGKFYGTITCEAIKTICFTAPADGNYTLSFDVSTAWGAALFTSIGENDLRYRGMIHNLADGRYTETVYLKAGETYNVGFTRASGNYNADTGLTPFTDTVHCNVSNYKVTYNGKATTFNFLDSHFGGNDYTTGNGIFTVGIRGVASDKTDAVGAGINVLTSLIDETTTVEDRHYIEPSNLKPARVSYVAGSWYNEDKGAQQISDGIFVSTAQDSENYPMVNWIPAGANETVIRFTAPTCGTYSFDFITHELWGDAKWPSRYYVEANGTILEGCDFETPGNKNAMTMTGTVTLKGGESIYFVYNPGSDKSLSGNSAVIDKLVVTLDEEAHTGTVEWDSDAQNHWKAYTCCGLVSMATEAHTWGTDAVCDKCGYTVCQTTYDFISNFTNLAAANFTVGMVHRVHGGLSTNAINYYDGSEGASNAATGAPLVGYQIVRNGDGNVKYYSYVTKSGSDIIFFPQANDISSSMVFVAPVDGYYSYDFEAQSKWNVSHSRFGFYVTLGNKENGEIVKLHGNTWGEEGINNGDPSTHVAAAQTAVDYEGTVYLTAGQKIYFSVDPVDGTAGDNALLKKLQVTLVHSGGTATCKDKAVCEQCGASYGDLNANNHASGSVGYIDNGDGTHDQVRACCGEVVINDEAHTYGDDNKCDLCANTCGHAGGTATCKTQATCTVCGQKYGELDPTNHEDKNGTWTKTATKHSFNRTCCDATDVAAADHVWGNDNVCDVCNHTCATTYTFNTNTFGSHNTDGYFTFGYVDGDNGAGSIHTNNFKPAVVDGDVLKSATGTVLFKQVNGADCMAIVPGGVGTGYTTVILFTAPAAGTYTLSANFHKWGSGSTVEVGFACPPQSFYKGPGIFSENDVRKTINETITLAEGEKVGFYVRGWAGGNITVNSLSISLTGHAGNTATCTDPSNCVICGTNLAGTNASNHTDKNGTWTKDQEGHSFNRTCCDATDVATEAHTYENGVCTECGYTCVHNGGTATCKTQATCSDCGQKYGELNANNHEDTVGTWSGDENGHSFNRTCCDATDIANAPHNNGNDAICDDCGFGCNHTGGTATCKTQATCDTCGQKYGNLNANNHEDVNGTWTKDQDGHAFDRTCCDATDSAKADHTYADGVCSVCGYTCVHNGGTATCKTQATCSDCGQKYGNLDANNHEDANGTWTKDQNGHSFNRTCCDATDVATEDHDYEDGVCTECGYTCVHNGGTATCKTQAVCDDCGESYGNLDADNHEDVNGTWTKDQDGHAFNRTCCDATDSAKADHTYVDGVCSTCNYACVHNGGDADCENKAVCDDCDEEYGDLADCNFVDGTCTVCGEADPDYVAPAPDTSDNTLAIAMLIAGIGLLAFALIPSKKRR